MKISEKQLEVITRTALEFFKKEEEKQKKKKQDRRLRNIKLLLRNYRSFSTHCADIKLEINDLNKKLELDELDTDTFAVESIKRSKERTLAMVKFINQMIEVYRLMCERTGKPEELRRYNTVYLLYIAEEKTTAENIAERHNTNTRTVYKDVDRACETLSGLVFGIDSLYF